MSEKLPQSQSLESQRDATPEEELRNELRKKLDNLLYYGTYEELEGLLDSGMDVNEMDAEGRTALQILTAKGDKERVEMLLSRGADVNKVFTYQGLPKTALDAAREENRKEIENILLQNGAKSGEEMLKSQGS